MKQDQADDDDDDAVYVLPEPIQGTIQGTKRSREHTEEEATAVSAGEGDSKRPKT